MSSRAIQRLREERESAVLPLDQIIDEEDDHDDETPSRTGQTAFLAMLDDSEDEDSEGSEEVPVVSSNDRETEPTASEMDSEDAVLAHVKDESPLEDRKMPPVDTQETTEDLDAILAEFQARDADRMGGTTDGTGESSQSATPALVLVVVLNRLDLRDLDMEYVMRTSLLAGGNSEAVMSRPSSRRTQQCLFGSPRDGWVRPPHYVGGGIKMTTYDLIVANGDNTEASLPWPYQRGTVEVASPWKDLKRWYTFQYSDTYQLDLDDYHRIQETGDANALALFVAHHPFVVEALLQLSSILYHTNRSQEGMALLRRALWICECSSLSSFVPSDARKPCFVDYDRKENKPLFMAMFRLLQVSSIAGCVRTSLAVARYLLSLDLLRDPMGVLPIIDYFALSTMHEQHERFLVDLVESKQVTIHYKEKSTRNSHHGNLLDLPNWSYSYALALHRMGTSSADEDLHQRADDALQDALRRFPSILEQILDKNEVDTAARSFRTDWPAVLRPIRSSSDAIHYTTDSGTEDTILRHASLNAIAVLTKIFVERNAKLWSGDDTLLWMYKNCQNFSADSDLPVSLSPAVIRYSDCDPSDYDDRIRTLPMDVNPLDPGLLAQALVVDPNRRRFLRRPDALREQRDAAARFPGGGFLRNMRGAPQMNMIDPDSPMLEVFWRSLLPWNQVEGVPPPRR